MHSQVAFHLLHLYYREKDQILCQMALKEGFNKTQQKGDKMAPVKKTATKKKAPAKKVYSCSTCGKTTSERKHLCKPVKATTKVYTCDFCGATESDARHICKPKTLDLKYFCDACGRVATSKGLLCKPKQIKS